MSDTDALDQVLESVMPQERHRQIAAGEAARQKLSELIAQRDGTRPDQVAL